MTWTIPADAIAHDGDAEVVARVLAGDTEGFRILVERYEVSVLRIVRNLAPRSSSPEDIAQDVFVSAFVALATFDDRRGRFASWLFAIARNRSLNARKKMSPRLLEDPESLPDARLPDDACGNAEIRRRLDDALEALPIEQRTCFVLEEIVGLTTAQVAEVEGVAIGTIRSRLSRAKASLRAALEMFVGGET
ncbi:MAG TPA: RNA polymerase sigma factor [Polyangiaceae bacterium]|nr:RNA polymerase sigma factor [Polyangiaceae bacterium]